VQFEWQRIVVNDSGSRHLDGVVLNSQVSCLSMTQFDKVLR
jgi:hypothetical protein